MYKMKAPHWSQELGPLSHTVETGISSRHGLTSRKNFQEAGPGVSSEVIISHHCAHFDSMYARIGTMQRRLVWPLCKDDMQIPEALHIFLEKNILIEVTVRDHPRQTYLLQGWRLGIRKVSK